VLNKQPIFVNGFQRGGTNILMRLISSHPQVRILGAEVHELFYGRETQPVQKWLRRLTVAPVLLATRQHTFWPYRFYPRRQLPGPVGRYVDLLFYLYKQTAADATYTNGRAEPTWQEKRSARMVCKCVNGVVLAAPLFAEMYPDAAFIALARHGLALCEGFVRRGWSARRFGRMYREIGSQMLADASRLDNYHIVHFEDLLANPAAALQRVYGLAGLDVSETQKFKLQAKKSMEQNGTRQVTFGQQEKAIIWCHLDELAQHLRQDVNENQIARLAEADKAAFLEEAAEVMTALGYSS
jgi:hypothetical protein